MFWLNKLIFTHCRKYFLNQLCKCHVNQLGFFKKRFLFHCMLSSFWGEKSWKHFITGWFRLSSALQEYHSSLIALIYSYGYSKLFIYSWATRCCSLLLKAEVWCSLWEFFHFWQQEFIFNKCLQLAISSMLKSVFHILIETSHNHSPLDRNQETKN